MNTFGECFNDKPETLRQAQTFGIVLGRALDFGLCYRCASQMAWGHQLGFGRVTHEPCACCLPLVEMLPVARLNRWRSVDGEAAAPAPWREAERALEISTLRPVSGSLVPERPGNPVTDTSVDSRRRPGPPGVTPDIGEAA